jgi:hypothetical protein
MTYLPEPVVSLKVERESRIIYRSKDKRKEKAVDALDRPAAMCSPIPDQRAPSAWSTPTKNPSPWKRSSASAWPDLVYNSSIFILDAHVTPALRLILSKVFSYYIN